MYVHMLWQNGGKVAEYLFGLTKTNPNLILLRPIDVQFQMMIW